MLDCIGIDARPFRRKSEKRDGTEGSFESVIGIGVRTIDYDSINLNYDQIFSSIFQQLKIERKYKYYCFNDIKDNPKCWEILEKFTKEIAPHIHKLHIFYSMFSSKKIQEVKVYGRLSKQKKIKLSAPTRTYKEFIVKHLVQSFPVICAWRLLEKLNPARTQFHLDAFSGHTTEAYEELMESSFSKFVYFSGDCLNPLISTADLLIATFDHRLEKQGKLLLFENFRSVLQEFGDKLLAYPISNIHLPKITPLEKKPITPFKCLKRPVFWVFKGDDLMHSGVIKRSATYRNLLDIVANKGGCVKLFSNKDAENLSGGDFGVYFDDSGEKIINNYGKVGKKLIKQKIDLYKQE